MPKQKNLIIYQAKNGAIELRADSSQETLWATQAQIAKIFDVTPQNITIHLNKIYKEGELKQKATCKDFLQVQTEGKRKVKRSVQIYNLDAMISVGYRINSKVGTKFRQWATKTLKSHIVDGYTINPSRIKKNYQEFLRAVDKVQHLLPKSSELKTNDVLELVKLFSETWFSLSAYDNATFPKKGLTKRQVKFTAEELAKALTQLKTDLITKKEATQFFAEEKRKGNLEGIVGNVFQTAFGQDVYPTIEEKSAHLLYFIIKNHPFNDGNKRSGAFAFVWFLKKAKLLNTARLHPEALTALTLLIAESDPKEKERMIGVILLLLKPKS